MSFKPCPRCATPMRHRCPHCHDDQRPPRLGASLPLLVMGLALSGCGDKEDTGDTATEDTGTVSALYGVAVADDVSSGREWSGQSSSMISKRPKS